uniref:Uncharacterized protein n=1 Tax=Anguilla anguilla TaxID=7936 RepID=A0A0E9TC01_ANGAN
MGISSGAQLIYVQKKVSEEFCLPSILIVVHIYMGKGLYKFSKNAAPHACSPVYSFSRGS